MAVLASHPAPTHSQLQPMHIALYIYIHYTYYIIFITYVFESLLFWHLNLMFFFIFISQLAKCSNTQKHYQLELEILISKLFVDVVGNGREEGPGRWWRGEKGEEKKEAGKCLEGRGGRCGEYGVGGVAGVSWLLMTIIILLMGVGGVDNSNQSLFLIGFSSLSFCFCPLSLYRHWSYCIEERNPEILSMAIEEKAC